MESLFLYILSKEHHSFTTAKSTRYFITQNTHFKTHRTTPMERQLARDLHCRNAKRFRPPVVRESRGSSLPVSVHGLKTVRMG